MTRLLTCGFETGATATTAANDPEGQSIARTGTINSIISTNARISGLRARVNASVQGTLASTWTGVATRTYYMRICFYFTSVTPSANFTIASMDNTGLPVISCRLRTDSKLILLDNAGATINSTLSSALSINTWYVVEFSTTTPASGLATYVFKIDTTQIDTGTYTSNNFVIDGATIGRPNNTETAVGLLMDDWAVNDSAGVSNNTFPGSGHIVMLLPTSDSSNTGFEQPKTGTSDTTDIFASVVNVPPQGVVHSDVDANNLKYIFSPNNNSTDNAIFNMAKFTDSVASGGGGLGADDTVKYVFALARGGTSTTTSRNLAVTGVAPALAEGTLATGTTAAGTDPTGWVTVKSSSANTVADITATPQVKVRKGSSSTAVMLYDQVGLMAEYQVPQSKSLSDTVTLSDSMSKVSAYNLAPTDTVYLYDWDTPTVAAEGSIAENTTASNLTVTLPSHIPNDILMVVLGYWGPNTSGNANSFTTPSGWTNLFATSYTPTSEIDGRLGIYWFRATSTSTTNPVFTAGANWDTGTDTLYFGRAYTIRGCKQSGDPWDDSSNSGVQTAANANYRALTVSGNKRLCAQFGIVLDSTGLGTATSPYTAGTQVTSSTGTGASSQIFTQASSKSVGAVASGTSAPSHGAYIYYAVSFAPETPVTRSVTHPLSDSVTLSDAIAKTSGLSESDSVTLSDAITTKGIGLNKSDSVTLSDQISRVSAYARSFSDSVTLSDDIAKTVGHSLTDSVTLSDSIAKLVTLVKSDSITLSDATSLHPTVGLSDSVTLSDAIVKAIGINLSDSVTLVDVFSSVGNIILSLSDTITLSDSLSRTAAYSRTQSDSVTLSDSLLKAVTLYKSDTITLTDAFSKVSGFFLALSDDITLTDALSKSVTMSFEDTVTLIDFMSRVAPLGIISSAAKILGFSRKGDQFSSKPGSSDFSSKPEGEVGNDPHV